MHRIIRLIVFASFALLTFGTFVGLNFDDDKSRDLQDCAEPALRLLRFETGERFLYAVTRFTNRSTEPIYFYGHHPEVPMQSLESRGAAGWLDCGCVWCGSGAETHELKPGESIELRTPVARLDRQDGYNSIAFRTIDHSLPLRVRTHYGFAGEHAVKPVWSKPFRHPQQQVASTRE